MARARSRIRKSKTEAGVRLIYMEPVLRDELATYRAGLRDADRDGLVFATATGRRLGETKLRRRIIENAVELANNELEIPAPSRCRA